MVRVLLLIAIAAGAAFMVLRGPAETPEPPAGPGGIDVDQGEPAPGLPDAHELRIDAPRELVTRDKAHIVRWAPVGGVIPVNGPFEVDVEVLANDGTRTPVLGAEVSMSCFMPDHGHGMLREPKTEELGGGRYRCRGFLLHMGGYWTVSVNVLVDGLAATADDELNL